MGIAFNLSEKSSGIPALGAPTVTRTRIIRLGNERSIHLSYGDALDPEVE